MAQRANRAAKTCSSILQGAPGGALQVLELAAVEGPQEGCEAEQAEQECAGISQASAVIGLVS